MRLLESRKRSIAAVCASVHFLFLFFCFLLFLFFVFFNFLLILFFVNVI